MAQEIIPETGQPNWFKRPNLEKYYQVETDQKAERPNWVEGKILDDWLFNDSDYLPEDLKK